VANVTADKAKPAAARKPASAAKAPAPAAVEPVAATAAAVPVAKPVTRRVTEPKKAAVAATVEITPTAPAAPLAAAPTAKSEGPKIMTEATTKIEETVKAAAATTSEKATDMVKDLGARAKVAMEKSGEFAKDAMEFNKLNIEAVVEAGKIAAKGAQTAAQNAAELGRKNIEETTAMIKSISSVKAPADLFKIQGDFARSQFDTVVAEMSKTSEFYLKLAGEVFQPISTRYSVAADQIKARMAA
jgi:phasin family protein